LFYGIYFTHILQHILGCISPLGIQKVVGMPVMPKSKRTVVSVSLSIHPDTVWHNSSGDIVISVYAISPVIWPLVMIIVPGGTPGIKDGYKLLNAIEPLYNKETLPCLQKAPVGADRFVIAPSNK